MGTIVENFKGIEFVRVSALSKEQQRQIWTSFDQEKIIKIVQNKSLLNDCILYSDFKAWQSTNTPPETVSSAERASMPTGLGRLAFE